MTPDWKSVGCEFKYRNVRLIGLILNSKYEKPILYCPGADNIPSIKERLMKTSMHSCRMGTARLLTVSHSIRIPEGYLRYLGRPPPPPKTDLFQGCARFAEISSELTKSWSSGTTEF